MTELMMNASQISVRFGGLWAVKDVDMDVKANEILGIMGPNGAGKSTFLNVLSGLQKPTTGLLKVKGQAVVSGKPWKMTQYGLARSFQTVRLLPQMSVLDNVLVGGHLFAAKKPWDILFRTPAFRKKEKELVKRAQELLEFMEVGDKLDDQITSLSMQERRRVEIARSLMSQPHILLLDEPCAGLSPSETDDLSQVIRSVKSKGISIILVEHNVKMILSLSDRIIVLDHGKKIAEGSPSEITQNESVINAYLGGAVDA